MIKKTLLAAAAFAAMSIAAYAADLPTQKGPPVYAPPPPIFTWTGVYIGGQVGYEWGTSSTATYAPGGAYAGSSYFTPSGVVGGAHLGYNYQINQFVVGLEGDVNGSSYTGSSYSTGSGLAAKGSIPIDGSVRGRVGYAWDRALIYATGGAAFGDLKGSSTLVATGATDSFTSTRVGWTVGGGVDYAIDNNWSVGVEYRYTDFGKTALYMPLSAAGATSYTHTTDNKVEAGFSYKFDLMGAPILAKY